ncbi:MAG: PfkB family carbohydrate kinase [Pseudomonadales bacterium]
MSKVLVCGSIAIDLLGTYAGSFADYQARYPINALNFSLQLQELRSSFGGCGMNIVYGLTRLNIECLPLTAAGVNFYDHYRDHLQELGVNLKHIVVDSDYAQCATAIVISDQLGNQITSFYAGASPSPKRKLPSEIDGIDQVRIAVLAPEDAPIMLRQARDLHSLGIPVLFDPGQGISEFSREELRELLSLSAYVIANAHEWEIIQLNAGLAADEIVADQREVIVTLSQDGVDILKEGQARARIPALKPDRIVEVTGSGDAFRAGYIAGLLQGLPSAQCARIGSLMAIYNLESPETQRYHFTPTEFRQRYARMWSEELNLSSLA